MAHSPTMGTNSSEIKAHNMSAILRTLQKEADVSRMVLAAKLGVSNATITNLVSELMERGFVADAGVLAGNGQVGRPQRALELVWDARYVVGIHIDVGMVHVALANLGGVIVRQQTFLHDLTSDPLAVLDEMCATVDGLIFAATIPRELVVGVGVAASGLVDVETGVNLVAPNLNWRNVPIGDYLRDQLQMNVVVENNVRAMAFGEAMFGGAETAKSLAFIYGRIGVGAGLVVDGQLYRGAAAGAGEIGHSIMLVPCADGSEQTRVTTLESLISERALLEQVRHQVQQHPTGILARFCQPAPSGVDAIIAASRAGDEYATHLLLTCAEYLGIALANLVNIFNPQLIVLGGLFSRGEGHMLPAIEASMRRHAFAHLGQQVEIRMTRFGGEVGMVGSAAMALDAFFYHAQNYVS